MIRSVRTWLALGISVSTLLAGSVASATVFTVSNTDDSGPGSLRQAITDANADNSATPDALHTITFEENLSGTINLAGRLDSIQNHVAINGPGSAFVTVTRDADIPFRIFAVATGYTVSISGLTITNGSDSSGGGIYNLGRLTLSHCVFNGNSASGQGGAIYSNFRLTVSATSFSTGTATEGGAIYNGALGIAILDSCIITGNASSEAGGIKNRGTLTLTNSDVSANSAAVSNGGAFANVGEATIRRTRLLNNTGVNDGGGIYNASSATLTIDSTSILNNNGGYGGGIENFGELTVTNSIFSGNSTDNNGGAIDNSGTVTITNCELSDNTAVNGGAIDSFGPLTVTSCAFAGNIASKNGGAIENFAGGTVANSTFSGNRAADGGALFNSDFGNMRIDTTVVFDNQASNDGGAILNKGTVMLISSVISQNKTTNRGGAVLNSGTLTVAGSEITGNSATHGGGIFNTLTVAVSNSTLSANAAIGDGGALYTAGTLMLNNATIYGNTATEHGGGIFISVGSVLPINTIIAGGTAPLGPDVHGMVMSRGHNIIGNADSSSGWDPSDRLGSTGNQYNPKLAPLRDNGGPTKTMELMAGSPAVNTGDNAVLEEPYNLTTDQRGNARKIGPYVDIGAFESAFTELSVPDERLTNVGSIPMLISPNPARRAFRIDYTLATAATVTLEMYTGEGARVAVVLDGIRCEAGDHEAWFDASALPPGTYTARLIGGSASSIRRFVVVR